MIYIVSINSIIKFLLLRYKIIEIANFYWLFKAINITEVIQNTYHKK